VKRRRPPFAFEAMDEAEARRGHREVLEWRATEDPFVEGLVRDFAFPDRAAVAEFMMEAGPLRYEQPSYYDHRRGDTLDQLYQRKQQGKRDGEAPIDEVVRLLEDDLNAYRLWCELARRDPDRAAEIDDELAALPDRLRAIAAAARAAHRKREQKSGPLAKIDLLELAQLAAHYLAPERLAGLRNTLRNVKSTIPALGRSRGRPRLQSLAP
jgi:hypothetical protein